MDELAQVKVGARVAWGAGDFTPFAAMLADAGARLLDRMEVRAGDALVDVGCGTGNLAVQAALAGARVTGVDIAPEMIERARATAAAAGVDIAFTVGDAEDLPLPDASADVVVSSFGCMFAPRHAVTAREIARVVCPGGRIGLLTWPPDSAVADFLALVGAHMPPPPDVAEPPLLWGDLDHARSAFAGTGVTLAGEHGTITFAFDTAEEATDLYLTHFGPLVAARAALEPMGRWQPLADAIAAHFAGLAEPDGLRMVSDYLLIAGRRDA